MSKTNHISSLCNHYLRAKNYIYTGKIQGDYFIIWPELDIKSCEIEEDFVNLVYRYNMDAMIIIYQALKNELNLSRNQEDVDHAKTE